MVRERIVLANTNDMYSFNNGLKEGLEKGKKEGAITFCKRVRGVLKIGLEHNETLEGFEEAFIELEKELGGETK